MKLEISITPGFEALVFKASDVNESMDTLDKALEYAKNRSNNAKNQGDR